MFIGAEIRTANIMIRSNHDVRRSNFGTYDHNKRSVPVEEGIREVLRGDGGQAHAASSPLGRGGRKVMDRRRKVGGIGRVVPQDQKSRDPTESRLPTVSLQHLSDPPLGD